MQRDGVRTITKKDLAERIAESTGDSRACVRRVLQSLLDEIVSELGEGNRIEFRDFGVFETKTRAARVAQNPRTLQRVEVPARRSVKFKPGRRMRESIEDTQPPQSESVGSSGVKPGPQDGAMVEPKLGAPATDRALGNHSIGNPAASPR